MDYEKEYNEVFQRAKELHEAGNALTKQQMEIVFPSLAESKDKRISKALINYFKAHSALVGENWNGIECDDVLAYLEKQKELPFVKDVMLGYPGLYFYDGERMHFQGNPAMEENQEKKKESHYTKRNSLFDKCVENCNPEVMKKVSDEIDAQLEKEQKSYYTYEQSKQAAEDCYYDKGYNTEDGGRCNQQSFLWGFEEGVDWCEQQKEQKPSIVEKLREISTPADEDWFKIQKQWEKEDEQKPRINIDQLKSLMLQYLQEAANEKDDSDIEADTDKWARKILGYDFEQKPAEWSEEDEKHRQNCLKVIKMKLDEKPYPYYEDYLWLKSLPERFHLQPKQEWSEEDENKLNHILEIVHIASGSEASVDEKEELESFLKSLRPQPHTVSIKDATKFGNLEYERGVKDGIQSEKSRQWKPSEQERGALRTAMHVLTEERNFPKAAEHLQAILDAFGGKESRKDFKPSEEQMEALSWLIAHVAPSEKYIVIIKNLYEQLKGLM